MSGIEILGIAAGVVQIAELGGKLSVKLFTFTRKIKNADRNIDSISQDIAATGAVLQQLGNELKKDEKLRLCSPEAIATARSLMEECHRIFKELNDAVDGNGKGLGSGAKVILGLRQRLKYPFLEPQIELLKANLEKLKSSLLVMLNVLIFAEQLKNQEALPILKDQRELLKSLVEEKIASQKQYDLVLKRLDQLTVGNDDSSISSLSKEANRTTDSNITLVNSFSSFPAAPAQPDKDSLLPKLPTHLHHRAEEIFDHCRLVNAVIEEVNHTQYKLDLGIRYRTQEIVLDSHYNEWVGLIDAQHTDGPHHDIPLRYEFLESTPRLKHYWERKQQLAEQKLQQMQLYAQQQQEIQQRLTQVPVMRQQQMNQGGHQQMTQRMLQAMQQQQQQGGHQERQQMDLHRAPGPASQRASYPPVSISNLDPKFWELIWNWPRYATLRDDQMLKIRSENLSLQYQSPAQFREHIHYLRVIYGLEASDPAPGVPTTPQWPTSFGPMARMSPVAPAAQPENHALQDYQMQMMLVEQQNKKRLMMARQEQDCLSAEASGGEVALATTTNASTNLPPSNAAASPPLSKRQRARSRTPTPPKRFKASRNKNDTSVANVNLDSSLVKITAPEEFLQSAMPMMHFNHEDLKSSSPPLEPAQQPDFRVSGSGETFNLDFSVAEGGEELENFDFDSFLNGNDRVGFDFDQPKQVEDHEVPVAARADEKKQDMVVLSPLALPYTTSYGNQPSEQTSKISTGKAGDGKATESAILPPQLYSNPTFPRRQIAAQRFDPGMGILGHPGLQLPPIRLAPERSPIDPALIQGGPLPPPQSDKPIASPTYIPIGDSFGPGARFPPLDLPLVYATETNKKDEQGSQPGKRKPYLHESRHSHARRRPRGPGGRFLIADGVAAVEKEGEFEDSQSPDTQTIRSRRKRSPPVEDPQVARYGSPPPMRGGYSGVRRRAYGDYRDPQERRDRSASPRGDRAERRDRNASPDGSPNRNPREGEVSNKGNAEQLEPPANRTSLSGMRQRRTSLAAPRAMKATVAKRRAKENWNGEATEETADGMTVEEAEAKEEGLEAQNVAEEVSQEEPTEVAEGASEYVVKLQEAITKIAEAAATQGGVKAGTTLEQEIQELPSDQQLETQEDYEESDEDEEEYEAGTEAIVPHGALSYVSPVADGQLTEREKRKILALEKIFEERTQQKKKKKRRTNGGSSALIPQRLQPYMEDEATELDLDTNPQDEEDYTIKCICGYAEEDGNTAYCPKCDTWQHTECYYPSKKVPENHFCSDCMPRELDTKGAVGRQRVHRGAPDGRDRKIRRLHAKVQKTMRRGAFPRAETINSWYTNERHAPRSGHDEDESVEAGEEIPMREKEGVAEEAEEAMLFEPREDTRDEDEDVVAYSDEELQAENKSRKVREKSSAKAPITIQQPRTPPIFKTPQLCCPANAADISKPSTSFVPMYGEIAPPARMDRISRMCSMAQGPAEMSSETRTGSAPSDAVYKAHLGNTGSEKKGSDEGSGFGSGESEDLVDLMLRYTLLEEKDLKRVREGLTV